MAHQAFRGDAMVPGAKGVQGSAPLTRSDARLPEASMLRMTELIEYRSSTAQYKAGRQCSSTEARPRSRPSRPGQVRHGAE